MNKNIILNKTEIENIINRISYQIYETFIDDNKIIIAGISRNGYILAEKISSKLKEISEIQIILCEVYVDKKNPKKDIKTSIKINSNDNYGLILIDDVLNTGSTLIYGVKHFLNYDFKKIKTVVLIDRNHKKFPVKADFKGISLSTSLKEHITVVFEDINQYAYLD